MHRKLIALGALAVLAATPAAANATTDTRDCGGGNTITFDGDQTLWPPNHTMHSFTITATSAVPVDQVTLNSTGTSDELVDGEELNGTGNTTNDVQPATASNSGTGSTSITQAVRAERSGFGDGRTYTITANATFGFGAIPCTQQFTVTVPHDQRSSSAPAPTVHGTLSRKSRTRTHRRLRRSSTR